MRKVVVSEYVTVDGVFEDLDRWHFDFWHDEIAKYKSDELLASGGLLMGRVTYEVFASTWPDMTDEEGFAGRTWPRRRALGAASPGVGRKPAQQGLGPGLEAQRARQTETGQDAVVEEPCDRGDLVTF
jgi:hypothetical protein